jgi:hypothetical protein
MTAATGGWPALDPAKTAMKAPSGSPAANGALAENLIHAGWSR